jgi:hypothetical protein
MNTAPNFGSGPGTVPSVPLYPRPVISHFTTRSIVVPTSAGPKAATEITIHGSNFAIRAAEPDVIVNGTPLLHFRISNDFQTLVGYFFGTLTQPVFSVIVDYGEGVRGEWIGTAGGGGSSGANQHRLLAILLLLLLLLLVVAAAVLFFGGVSLSALGWSLLLGAIVVDIVTVALVAMIM